MKAKDLFQNTPYTWEDFKRDFRIVTEQNARDAVLCTGVSQQEELDNAQFHVGRLVDVRANCDVDDITWALTAAERAAWQALLLTKQDELFEELSADVEVMWWMGDGERVRWEAHSITSYLEPEGEGGTQVDWNTWEIWKQLGYTREDWL